MTIDVIYNMKREMLRRGLSIKTINTYLNYVRKFLLFCKDKDIKNISKKDVREYLYFLKNKGLSGSSLNVVHNALRFMMIEILHKGMYLKIKFSKTPLKKAEYLTKKEVQKILSIIKNDKHYLLVALMYGAGLRVSELVKLEVKNFDLSNNIGWVRNGKGGKDRPFIIPITIKEKIKEKISKSNKYIFPGRLGHISVRTVQKLVRDFGKKANIKKHIHPHIFRHSFTTHLLENNEDIVTVQTLLGHVSASTTLGYSHIVNPNLINTKSPLDDFD